MDFIASFNQLFVEHMGYSHVTLGRWNKKIDIDSIIQQLGYDTFRSFDGNTNYIKLPKNIDDLTKNVDEIKMKLKVELKKFKNKDCIDIEFNQEFDNFESEMKDLMLDF